MIDYYINKLCVPTQALASLIYLIPVNSSQGFLCENHSISFLNILVKTGLGRTNDSKETLNADFLHQLIFLHHVLNISLDGHFEETTNCEQGSN